ncbi:DUF4270 domain-containing protein [Pedobacter riviphilus]|uniref:DUF4270 domain-containing protein n=1 Tax=Pedobacter riviphilus TaxID=2766984 RepID=A0ABX6THT5_9SPHI|nr:DUF4270 domain-containing protein [Pedobacter riviphilus]QNR84478.1 DUF4270 domain-containing protein [Pedobacter riviphilus]
MKFTKQDLLTLLIGLFLFASCKNPDGVGLDVDPSTAITGTLVVSPVKSQLVQEDPANTYGLNRYPLGYMVDPVFGKTEAALALTVYPVSTSYDFGTSPVLDSAVLVLKIDTTSTLTKFYGDTTNSKYSIDVYQLANKVTTYKSSDVQSINNTLLGNFTGKLAPNTKRKVLDIVPGKADTLKTVPAQIRIPLNKAFIQNAILNLGTAGTATDTKFIESFKGLYAQINKTSSTGVGGIAFINFSGADSYLQLVWKKTNSSNGVDTTSVNFPIGRMVTNGAQTANVISGIAANIKHDYAGTPVQDQITTPNPSAPYSVTYLQGLAGVKTKLTFPELTNFKGTYGKAIINKAELVVELGESAPAYPFNAAQRLSLYRWDIAHQAADIPDYTTFSSSASGGAALFGGYFDSLKKRYIFIVTSYVQSLIDKNIEDYGTFLAPTSYTDFQRVSSATSAERSIIGASDATANKIKLNIYYTKIN